MALGGKLGPIRSMLVAIAKQRGERRHARPSMRPPNLTRGQRPLTAIHKPNASFSQMAKEGRVAGVGVSRKKQAKELREWRMRGKTEGLAGMYTREQVLAHATSIADSPTQHVPREKAAKAYLAAYRRGQAARKSGSGGGGGDVSVSAYERDGHPVSAHTRSRPS